MVLSFMVMTQASVAAHTHINQSRWRWFRGAVAVQGDVTAGDVSGRHRHRGR
jgi:hypothetical protein